MRCTVRFFLDEVSCPGTIHLADRNPVFLSICLFGRFQKSPHVYPSFPMCFSTKIKFQRLFTNAKTPEQVLEILEDETILIELRQHTKGLKGGKLLAVFEESTRAFLFPTPSHIPKRNEMKRDVLLARTENFPVVKGLDPQFSFITKTYIEEGPFIHTDPHEISVNRQIPPSELSHEDKGKKNSPLKHHDISNEADTTAVASTKHCICDCPSLDDDPAALDYWLETSQKKKKKKGRVKPFRAGKAPKQLISKREFGDSFRKKKGRGKKGICPDCVVPLSSCVLCNAYKSVYGPNSFLIHRFDKQNGSKADRSKRNAQEFNVVGKDDANNLLPRSPVCRIDESILNTKGNLKPIKSKPKPSFLPDSSLNEDIENFECTLPPRSSTRASDRNHMLLEERLSKSVPPTVKPPKNRHTAEHMYELESQRIHERIRNLMKKNESVLQYDLSSDDSITDEEDEGGDESLDSSLEEPPPRRNLPAKSVVEPLRSDMKWASRSGKDNHLTHRDKLDSRLKEIYADLYQKTLNNC